MPQDNRTLLIDLLDPKAEIGYGYVTSQMGTALTGDPRDVSLRNALYSILPPTA